MGERDERPHIGGVSKFAYVLATPRRVDWRRAPQHPSANDHGCRAVADVIARACEPRGFDAGNRAAILRARSSDGEAMLAIVQELGAVAGLASVMGLVVLLALYVSHARDVKRLRDWAGAAPEGLGPGIALPGRRADVPRPSEPQIVTAASGAPASLSGLSPATAAGAAPRAPVAPVPVESAPSTQRPVTGPTASQMALGQDALAPVRRSPPRRRRTGARLAPVLVVLAVGGMVTYGVSQMLGGDGAGESGKTRATGNGPSREQKRRVVVNPGAVTVAVLNGTTVNGLAAALRDHVAAAGFRSGTIDVFSDQQLAESVVEYAPGHLAAAKAVGRVLAISRYQPVTANSRALAADATVIVVVGSDKAAAAPATP
ncbi:MAG TPA: LytR C-terminal domain-containing protein [Baekduia sp.]|nr:LytR C-terminal domain-containing protein [Baekduia sp.]